MHSRLPSALALIVFITAFVSLQHLQLSVSDMRLSVNGGAEQAVQLPYTLKSSGKELLTFESTLHRNPLSASKLKIIPDDCITSVSINGRPLNMAAIPNRCNWSKGVEIDLESYLHSGENTLQIVIRKKDGVGGLNVFGLTEQTNGATLLFALAALFSLGYLVIALTREQLGGTISILLAAGVILQFHYLSYTDFSTRTFDLLISTGHLDYIKMIAHDFALPNPTEGWEYHQPPLYYLAAAIIYAFFEALPLIDPMVALQLFSLLLFTLFLYYSLHTLKLLITDEKLLALSALLLIFWPSGVIHSIRIGNDILFFTLFALGVNQIVRWQLHNASFRPVLLVASLALITKANGIILFGVIGILLLIDLYRRRDIKTFGRLTAQSILFFIAAFAVNFADNIYYALAQGSQDWLVSNVVNTLNKKLFVANEAFNYLYFDLQTYLKAPFINPWDDQYGRQFFWNYLFKSALFSEFFFPAKAAVASVMGALSLLIFGYIVTGMLSARPTRGALIMALVLLLSLAALLLYRIKIPVACNTDFRYIYPVIIPMAFFFAQAQSFFKARRLPALYYGGYVIALFFCIGTVAVFL